MTSVLNDTVLHVLATLSPVVCLCTILFIDNNFLPFKFCASLTRVQRSGWLYLEYVPTCLLSRLAGVFLSVSRDPDRLWRVAGQELCCQVH